MKVTTVTTGTKGRSTIVFITRPPHWRRAHRDWWFRIGLIPRLTAQTIYITSDDLAFLPHR